MYTSLVATQQKHDQYKLSFHFLQKTRIWGKNNLAFEFFFLDK